MRTSRNHRGHRWCLRGKGHRQIKTNNSNRVRYLCVKGPGIFREKTYFSNGRIYIVILYSNNDHWCTSGISSPRAKTKFRPPDRSGGLPSYIYSSRDLVWEQIYIYIFFVGTPRIIYTRDINTNNTNYTCN